MAATENLVKTRAEVERLHLGNIANNQQINSNELEYPQLILQYLRDIIFEIYQLKLVPAYIEDKMQRENVKHFHYQVILYYENGLLRFTIIHDFDNLSNICFRFLLIQSIRKTMFKNRFQAIITNAKQAIELQVLLDRLQVYLLGHLEYAHHNDNVTYPSNRLLHEISNAAEKA